jgi:hypothetical protein
MNYLQKIHALDITQVLLQFVLGDGPNTDRLARAGLAALRDADIDLSKFMSVLDASARYPVNPTPNTGLVSDLAVAGFPLLVLGPGGIDFTPPYAFH